MPARKTLDEQINKAQDEIAQRESRLKELRAKQKVQERKARNHRLCKRTGLLEKYLPDTITLTDEQFQAFIEEAVANDYGKRKLAHIIAPGADKYPPKPTEKTPAQGKTTPAKPAEAKPNPNSTTQTNGGNSEANAD